MASRPSLIFVTVCYMSLGGSSCFSVGVGDWKPKGCRGFILFLSFLPSVASVCRVMSGLHEMLYI